MWEMKPDDHDAYVSCEAYHERIKRPYSGDYRPALNKKHALMAKVLYVAPHENRAERGVKRGSGNDWATWVFSEEPGTAEGIFESGLELMIDARMEPGACVGLHTHEQTEEVYYLLEGSIEMTTVDADGREHTEALQAGDAHFVRIGQSHYGKAGPKGVRFIAVAGRR